LNTDANIEAGQNRGLANSPALDDIATDTT